LVEFIRQTLSLSKGPVSKNSSDVVIALQKDSFKRINRIIIEELVNGNAGYFRLFNCQFKSVAINNWQLPRGAKRRGVALIKD